jgi:4-amino-4-deoxy-L-arabinose transferase-like glycosyltransferase
MTLVFVILTFTLFNVSKPIIDSFENSYLHFSWYLYIFLIPVCIIAIYYCYNRFLCRIIINCNKLILIGITIVTTAIPRVLWINLVNVIPKDDFELYQGFAKALARGEHPRKMYVALFPHTYGYPYFLSLFYRILGFDIKVAQYLNVFLCCSISVVLFILGSKLFSKSAGFISSMILAFWPSQIFYTVLLSNEALFSLLMLLIFLLFYISINQKRNIYKAILFSAIGILIAISNSVRPLGIVLLLASLIHYIVIVNTDQKNPYKFKLLLCTLLIVSYAATSSLISFVISSAINIPVAKLPIGFSAYVGSNIKYSGVWNVEDSIELNKLIEHKYSSQEIHDIMLNKAVERFYNNSYRNLEFLVSKHKVIWATDNDNIIYISSALDPLNPSRIDYLKYMRLINKVSNLYYYIILLICGVFILTSFICKLENTEYMHLLIVLCGIIVTHMIVEVAGRYHYPMIPIFSLIVSGGITNIKLLFSIKSNGLHRPVLTPQP